MVDVSVDHDDELTYDPEHYHSHPCVASLPQASRNSNHVNLLWTHCPPDKWRIGLVYGGGAEWKFDRNWSAKIEYLHVDFENQQYFTPPSAAMSANGITAKAGGVALSDDVVRFGLNYKLERREAVPLK